MRYVTTFALLLTSSAFGTVVSGQKTTPSLPATAALRPHVGTLSIVAPTPQVIASCTPTVATGREDTKHRCPPEQLRREPACGFRDLSALQGGNLAYQLVGYYGDTCSTIGLKEPATLGAVCSNGKGGEEYSELDISENQPVLIGMSR
ncbi:hypothetical protein B0H13DRAFT_2558969 [Mycena leptocephala]|nr:hypothetical protein B0H13DRAFT_2558969 [Mycena leptocephala]